MKIHFPGRQPSDAEEFQKILNKMKIAPLVFTTLLLILI